jgi:hypothetical protein
VTGLSALSGCSPLGGTAAKKSAGVGSSATAAGRWADVFFVAQILAQRTDAARHRPTALKRVMRKVVTDGSPDRWERGATNQWCLQRSIVADGAASSGMAA